MKLIFKTCWESTVTTWIYNILKPPTSILNIKVEVLFHAHGGVRAIDDELLWVVEVHAESFRGVEEMTRRRVDQALVTLKRSHFWNYIFAHVTFIPNVFLCRMMQFMLNTNSFLNKYPVNNNGVVVKLKKYPYNDSTEWLYLYKYIRVVCKITIPCFSVNKNLFLLKLRELVSVCP